MSVEVALVDVSWIVRRLFGLLVTGWFSFHLVIPVRFLDRLQDQFDRF